MKKWLWYTISCLVFLVIFRTFLLTSYVVDGRSMEPALRDGELAFINVIGDIIHPVETHDIIFFKVNDQTFVKRVVATPHDYVSVHHQYLYVNGERYSEQQADYRELLNINGHNGQVVHEKCYIVLGDNLKESVDSRTFGCVNEHEIMGKVIGHLDTKFNE